MSKSVSATRGFLSRHRRKLMFAGITAVSAVVTTAVINRWQQEKELAKRETITDEVYATA